MKAVVATYFPSVYSGHQDKQKQSKVKHYLLDILGTQVEYNILEGLLNKEIAIKLQKKIAGSIKL